LAGTARRRIELERARRGRGESLRELGFSSRGVRGGEWETAPYTGLNMAAESGNGVSSVELGCRGGHGRRSNVEEDR